MTGMALSSCAPTGARQYTDMDVNRFAGLISDTDVQLLDVRTPEEYEEGHIRDAVNINVFDPDFVDEAADRLVKDRPVAVYCRSGKRSADAAAKLAAQGYKVTNLEGGILAWEEAGKSIEK